MPDPRSPYRSLNPRSGETGATFDLHTDDEREQIVQRAAEAAAHWRTSSLAARTAVLRGVGAALRQQRDRLAELASAEMGKRLDESLGEVDKCATLCDTYAQTLASSLAARPVRLEGAHAAVHYRPLGVILGIMPWNFPYWQAARFCLPAVAAGNATLLKHAPNVPGCAEAFTRLITEAGRAAAAGVPLLQNLRTTDAQTEALIADPRIAGVSLTGSTRAGRAVGAAAGKALKPSVLELGGSDAYLILADADLPAAVDECVRGRLLNAGQSCISPKRLIVVEAAYAEFRTLLLRRLGATPYVSDEAGRDRGDGQLAPLARADLREHLHRQVNASRAGGATLALGGSLPDGPGFFYPATVLEHVRPGVPAFDEELFGPVFALVSARDETEAIALANASEFGLGAAVFSRDLARAEDIATNALQAGACFVNAFVRSDPRLPFGGVKQSGYGRELAEEGLRAFCNVKTVYVARP